MTTSKQSAKSAQSENTMNTKNGNAMNNDQKCIVVLNYLSCGKTTLTDQMFQPALNAEIVSIETINKDAKQAKGDVMSAEKFRQTMQKMEFYRDAEEKNVIVDVGVSNVELFLTKMKAANAFGDFDFFFVPITPDVRGLRDSIQLLNDLATLYSVPADKIRVIFNKVPDGEVVTELFSPIFKYHKNEGQKFTILPGAVVRESAAFPMIGSGQLKQAAESTSDLRAAMKAAKNDDEIAAISDARAVRRMAPALVAELEKVAKILLAK